MDYLTEFKKLPQFIQDILISPFGAGINDKIGNKYNFNLEQRKKMCQIVNDVFLKRLPVNEIEDRVKSGISNNQNSKQIAADIAGLKLLIADEYFNNKVSEYLKKLEFDLERYAEAVEKQKEAIKQELELYKKDQAKDQADSRVKTETKKAVSGNPPSEKAEKEASIELFKNNIISFLRNENKEINSLIADYNKDIILWIGEDKDFVASLENALYRNLQKLTHKHFLLEGKPHAPSVRNWIRDFIKQNGTNMFDNVVLTNYVMNSENGKNLGKDEKELVIKLLILYRNLKFFPESMKNLPVEKWEIIPVEDSIPEEKRPISGPPKTPAEKKIDELKQEEEKYGQDSLAGRAIEEEISHKKRIEDLQIEANKYPAGSLERRALEEEIKRLSE